MSNMTDGKKALALGEFEAAERKLMKALDAHPDKGELWWLLMLCKSECRDDAELERVLKARFSQAAENGEAVPSTPFDSMYCKNAVKYAASEKYSEYIKRVNAELSEIWRAARGREVKLAAVKPKKHTDKTRVIRALVYAALIFAACFGGVGIVGAAIVSNVMRTLGFIVFGISVAAAVALYAAAKRSGSKPRAAFAVLVGEVIVFAIALAAVGLILAERAYLIAGGVILAVSLVVGSFVLSRYTARRAAEKAAAKSKRSAEPRKAGGKNKNKRGEGNEKAYEDDFD